MKEAGANSLGALQDSGSIQECERNRAQPIKFLKGAYLLFLVYGDRKTSIELVLLVIDDLVF